MFSQVSVCHFVQVIRSAPAGGTHPTELLSCYNGLSHQVVLLRAKVKQMEISFGFSLFMQLKRCVFLSIKPIMEGYVPNDRSSSFCSLLFV